MKLYKQPETEMEYWEAIEGLGGFIWRMNHDLADGRIKDPSGDVAEDVNDSRIISNRLVVELGEKFGVIHPVDCPKISLGQTPHTAPEGKTYYWDWYKRMKGESYRVEYAKLICSACPFSAGVEQMMRLGGVIPCGVFSGVMYRLDAPHICGMTRDWGQTKLYDEIRARHGAEALATFQRKEAELKPV